MFGKKKPEVLVVGAGPVGLFTALVLAQRGLQVQIVDKDWRTGAHSYALALHGASLRLFQELGLADRLLEQGYPVRSVGLYDETQRRAEVRIGDPAEALPGLVVMPQDVLERVLEEALLSRGVTVHWNHALAELKPQADCVSVTLDKLVKESLGYAVAHTEWVVANSQELQVPFVIGTDGHRSFVRRALEIEYPAVGPTQQFAVFEFQTDMDLQRELRVVLGEQHTNAVWPMPNGFCRWSFQLPEAFASQAQRQKDRVGVEIGGVQFPVLSEDHLRTLLAERAPWFHGRIGEINWRMVVRFERRLANRFGSQRVWLAGDAGHVTGPVGMHSMNVGFREAHDLAECVATALRGGQAAGQFQAFETARQTEWRQLLGLSGGLRAGGSTEPWIGQRADRVLGCLPASGLELAQLAGQLKLEL